MKVLTIRGSVVIGFATVVIGGLGAEAPSQSLPTMLATALQPEDAQAANILTAQTLEINGNLYDNPLAGTVDRYLLNPQGQVDGLLLTNRVQVKFPPHLGDDLVQVFRPGDTVTIAGYPGVPTNLGLEVRAYQLANPRTQQVVVDRPPAYPPHLQPMQSAARYGTFSVSGRVYRWLVSRRGDIKGIVLESGEQIKFPPHVGYQLEGLAREGSAVQAEGYGAETPYGRVIEAFSLTVDGQAIAIRGFAPGMPRRLH
ncbi:hypothetical protein [Leptolyngbya sp. O-77]|uniref:hypothetical protein n=1 Tax=Leptolyngbya sp. O-77 TaxID=1080068 RepID=UPI00074D34E9|nr:hypothetical protein [Leptolyngbya sp. O-77]BAU44191.1 hypothetical protein O77CONTIG1_04030 [Leptolyngbya sp. O-77]